MDHQNREGETDIQIRQGYQDLDGENALGYVRYIDKRTGKSNVSSGRSVSWNHDLYHAEPLGTV